MGACVTSAVVLLLAACGGAATDPDAPEPLQLMTTTTILGDVARNVAGADAAVEVLYPVGADPHGFQPSSQDVASLEEADLVIANGLGLEEGLTDVLDGLEEDGAKILEVAEGLEPLPFAGEGGETGGDPHVWFDPLRVGDAARSIAVELSSIDPGVDWMGRAETYASELSAADEEIVEILAAVPIEDRKLITNHDSLAYFAQRYGFEIVGVVVPGGSTLAEPSSAELATLVDLIEDEGVRAIFVETTESPVLAEAIAAEVAEGVAVVQLHTGSLGKPGSGAETLIGMLTSNAERIAEALS
jgi:zinc/manganese transport system substrate-binding protein